MDVTQDGVTPIVVAAGNGQAEVVKLLIETGANLNQRAKVSFILLWYKTKV